MTLYSWLRPALFMLPPERAHQAAIALLQSGVMPAYQVQHACLATQVAGVSFASPIGLAAGFDKNAQCVAGALRAGCGFVEIGTVTPRAQPGNSSPRVFRLVAQEAIINRLGFNNAGVDAAAQRLGMFRQAHREVAHAAIIGGNIGKNKDSIDAVADYVAAMRALYPYVDYITANISSPNTPGLRSLQAADELSALIQALQTLRTETPE
jgi:dihydroorotate dehydrogenase